MTDTAAKEDCIIDQDTNKWMRHGGPFPVDCTIWSEGNTDGSLLQTRPLHNPSCKFIQSLLAIILEALALPWEMVLIFGAS